MTAATAKRQSLVVRTGKRIRRPLDRVIAASSRVTNERYPDPRQFPWVAKLESAAPAIVVELEALLASGRDIPAFGKISPDHRRVAGDWQWKSFFFEGYGYRVAHNRALCPQTAAAIDAVPDVVTAFYSIMEPHSAVPLHSGVTKALLNVHLGLKIPTGGRCAIEVGGEWRGWRQGKVLILDDTYPHQVINATDAPRVVLFIQVRRPVGPVGRLVGGLFLAGVRRTSYVQDGRAALDRAAFP